MSEFKFTIKGNPVPKKNNMQVSVVYNRAKRRHIPIVRPSKNFEVYNEYSQYQLNRITANKDFETIDYPINLQCVYYRSDLTECDITNLMNATHDILVEAGVIKDDNWKIVDTIDGTRIDFDEDNPRVEITITPKSKQRTALQRSLEVEQDRIVEKEKERKKKLMKKEKEKNDKCKQIVKYRDEDNLIWKDIAEKMDLSVSTVSKYYKEFKERMCD